MTYRAVGQLVPPIEPIQDPWYQRKARQLQRIAASTAGFGQEPPPPREAKLGLMLGWGAVIAMTAGIFWAATRGVGMRRNQPFVWGAGPVKRRRRRRRRRSTARSRWVGKHAGRPVRTTRRTSRRRVHRTRAPSTPWVVGSDPPRRNVRRGGRRRTTRGRRTTLRRYKALSASARRSMPQSSFALPGKRFPIEGPPGSSRERDKWQAMQAIRYLNMGRIGTKQEYLAVRNAVIRKYGAGFWRSYDGPTWKKVQSAKRKRATTRRRRPARRRVAANPKIVGGVARYATANVRRTKKRRSTAKSRVGYALSTLRQAHVSPRRVGLSSRIAASLARRPAGLYRVGKGKVTKYKGSTSLQGAMTSTRIAASASGETHWLVKVYGSGRPKVVVVRKINPQGKTVYRVEQAAQRARAARRRAAN